MTKDELLEKFDMVASCKTSNAVKCIRDEKSIKSANWHATYTSGELVGLYRGYTDVGEILGVCERSDKMFFTRMLYYRNIINEELAIFITKHSRK